MQHLTSSQAFWLGHFYQASRSGLSLPSYAQQQGLSLAELLLWRKRLQTIGLYCHKPARLCLLLLRWWHDPT